MEAKPWYQSKVVWVNVSAIVALVGALVMGDIDKPTALVQFGPIGLAIVNILLRLVTKQPLE